MKLVRNLVIVLVALVAVAYIGAIAYMFFNQRSLQYVATGPITPLAQTALTEAEEIAIPSGGSVVNGWYQAPSQGMPLILYYRGNSGSFSAEHQRFEQSSPMATASSPSTIAASRCRPVKSPKPMC